MLFDIHAKGGDLNVVFPTRIDFLDFSESNEFLGTLF